MHSTGSRNTGYVIAALLGVIVGGLVVAVATRVVPKMMAGMMKGMMQNMMAQMGEDGCNCEEMCSRMMAGAEQASPR